jgi:hypothetical protein
MGKRMTIYILLIVLLLFVFAAVILVTGITTNSTKITGNANILKSPTSSKLPIITANQSEICKQNNIPANSCSRAMQLHEYCPSWDAKPGQIAPAICIELKLTQ